MQAFKIEISVNDSGVVKYGATHTDKDGKISYVFFVINPNDIEKNLNNSTRVTHIKTVMDLANFIKAQSPEEDIISEEDINKTGKGK